MSDSPLAQEAAHVDDPPATGPDGATPPPPADHVSAPTSTPTPGEPPEVWTAPSAETRTAGGPGLSFGFNLGKVAGQGEDSDPILRDGRELGLVAVFDGMGGAGGTVYETA